MNCPKCQKEIELDRFPFCDGIQCENCLSVFETDWDYDADYDSMYWWITGEVITTTPPDQTILSRNNT